MKKELIIKRIAFALFLLTGLCTFTISNKLSCKQFASSTSQGEVESDSTYISPQQFNIDVLHYNLRITIQPEQKLVSGDVTITALIKTDSLSEIMLNLYQNMFVDSLFIANTPCTYTQLPTNIEIRTNRLYRSHDTVSIRIVYHGTPKNIGFSSFQFGEFNGTPLTATLSEPYYSSTWFPCDDRPDDKALLDMYITSDSVFTSVSNGKLIEVLSHGDKKTYHWKTVYPIAPYLICFYSSKYTRFTDTYISADKDTMPIEYYVTPKHLEAAKKDFEGQPKMIAFFSKLFGEYPFIKEKYGIAEFLWQGGAMEHQTIIGIGTSFVRGHRNYDEVYVHELAHHWFGDAVSPRSWKDIWLNEGFATYSEALYNEAQNGKAALEAKMGTLTLLKYEGTIYSPKGDMFSPTIYNKGAWILHMLRFEAGDSCFFHILRTYYNTYKYGNASTKDFTDIAERLSEKNLTQFFDQWIYTGTNVILADYTWKMDAVDGDSTKGYTITLSIQQKQTDYPCYKFPLEIEFDYGEKSMNTSQKVYIDNVKQTFVLHAEKKPNAITIDPHKWILGDFYDKTSYGN